MFNRKSANVREDLITYSYSIFLLISVVIAAVYFVYTCLKRPKTIAEKVREKYIKLQESEAAKLRREIKSLSSSAQTMAALKPKNSVASNDSSVQPLSVTSSSSSRNSPLTLVIKRKVIPPQQRQKTLSIQEKIIERREKKIAEEKIAEEAALREKQERELAMAKWRKERAEERAKRKLALEAAAKEKAAKEAKLKEEQELALAEWRKRKAEEKEQKKLAREAAAKEEAESSKTTVERNIASTTSTSAGIESAEAEPVKVVKNATLDGLKNHAIFLAGFEYSESAESSLKTLSETFAFLFNFHRFNLCRRNILAHTQQSYTAAELRTMLVHLTTKVDVTPNMIAETQQRLCQFIYTDVVKLVQKRSKHPVSPNTDEKIQELSDLTPFKQFKYSPITTLPLYQSLYESRDQINIERELPPSDLYSWMKNTIIPLLNSLRLNRSANFDAIKWVIIILGEHCDLEERLELKHHFPEIEPDRSINRGMIDKFMCKCREIRNDLAHEISIVSDKRIDNLLNRAALITEKFLDSNLDLDSLRPVVSEVRSVSMTLQ